MTHRENDDGSHSFSGDGLSVRFHLPLTDHHVRFLSGNPAAVRVCAVRTWFDLPWLDRLMRDVALIDASGSRSVH